LSIIEKENSRRRGIGSAKYGRIPGNLYAGNIIIRWLADETKKETVTLEELMVSNLAMADATVKLLIQKGVFTDEEFKANWTARGQTMWPC
jgi:hypothetical protein